MSAAGGAVARKVTIINKRGLHARAASRFVKLAETYDAEISVGRDGHLVSGVSMLAAAPGAEIELIAKGAQAAVAIDALAALVDARFDED